MDKDFGKGDIMKILVVFTGGTIGCIDKNDVLKTDESCSYLLLDMFKSYEHNVLKSRNSVAFETISPYIVLSENLTFSHLEMLRDCINRYDINNFDGVIVTHGTDTLQYTASYLSYAFSNCSKPIVLVSANYPLTDERSNGFENFVNAIDFIKNGNGKGVFVSYKNAGENGKIHRGARLLPHSAYSDEVKSVFNSFFGDMIDRRFVKNPDYAEQKDEITFDGMFRTGESVLRLNACVNMVYPERLKNIKAVLIEGYHSGTLNTQSEELRNFCRNAQNLNIPVLLTGACKGFYYESKLLFDRLNIRVLPVASPIAMYIKLSLLDKDKLDFVYLPCGGDFA